MQIRDALQGDFDEIAAISSSFCTMGDVAQPH